MTVTKEATREILTKTILNQLLRILALIGGLGLLTLGHVGAQTYRNVYTDVYDFDISGDTGGTNSDGGFPSGGLTLSSNTLFGTTQNSGLYGNGTVFRVNTDGTGFTNLLNFYLNGQTQGVNPGGNSSSTLVLSGNTLYGTTDYSYGTIFAINTDGTGYTNLHVFNDLGGTSPSPGLVLSGNTLYGTTQSAGAYDGAGVFKLNTDGSNFTNIYSFNDDNCNAGIQYSGLIISGNTLYGTMVYGGNVPGINGDGTVFRINTDGSGFECIHVFTGTDGRSPFGGLIQAGETLYGTTCYGGTSGLGTVYAVNTDGSGFTNLYSFSSASGWQPMGALTLSQNILYGTTDAGGGFGYGTVFAINTDGTGFSKLYSIGGCEYGSDANGGLILLGNTLYGTTPYGGVNEGGSVFALTLNVPLSFKSIGKPQLNSCIGYPISFSTGNLFQEVQDYATAGAHLLGLTRYYNSFADNSTEASTLGNNWRSTYDRYLRISLSNGLPSSVIMERPDGQELQFTNNSGIWMAYSDVDITLAQSGSSWIVTNVDDSIEIYNMVGANFASLASIQARSGYTQTLQYNAGNQLQSVTDSFGRSLQFRYAGNLLQSLTTPSGLAVSYGYNSSGIRPGVLDRLSSVTYSTTPQTTISYQYGNSSFPFALTGVTDEDGNQYETFGYDASGRAVMSQNGSGANLTTLGFDECGNCTVTNALGLISQFQYQTLQGVNKVIEVARQANAFVKFAYTITMYDTNGYVASFQDWNLNLTTYVNDAHGQPTMINETLGPGQVRSTTNTYLTNFHLPAQVSQSYKTTTFAYDANGNVLTKTEIDTSNGTFPYSTSGQSRIWTYTYDGLGNLLTAIGPRTDLTAKVIYTYDGSNNITTITDALGHVTQISGYNPSGLPLIASDPNGVVTSLTYDARDRLTSQTVQSVAGNSTTTFVYDASGLLTSTTLPNKVSLNYHYDASHRLISVTNLLGESIVYGLDAGGDVTNLTTRNASAAITRIHNYVFDALGRMLQDIGASSQTNTYAFDSDGNCVTFTDAVNNTTTRYFDTLNRVTTIIDPLYHYTHFAYDDQDNLISVSDPRGLVTSYYYNGFGDLIQESSPDKGATVYSLDAAGNRTSEVDARGIVTQRTFDALNRVTTEVFPASQAENLTYGYDATNGGNVGIGRLTSYADESGSTSLSYNPRGDVISKVHTIGGQAYTTGYACDLADNITNVVYPSGDAVHYVRDSQGRISSVVFIPNSTNSSTVLASNVTYMPFGPLSSLVYGNGLLRTHALDEDYHLTAINTSASTVTIQNLTLSYDNADDIKSITDKLDSTQNQTFAYDANYRLNKVTSSEGAVQFT